MWLVDADGRAVEPSYPLGECGFDNTLGLFEIQKMSQISAVEHRAQLNAETVKLLFGCSPVLEAPPAPARPTLSPPMPDPRSPLELNVFGFGFCSFDTTGSVPVFTGARSYNNTEPILGIDVLSRLSPAGPCGEQATSVVTTDTTDPASSGWNPLPVVVELDGCRRILAEGFIPREASASIISALRTR